MSDSNPIAETKPKNYRTKSKVLLVIVLLLLAVVGVGLPFFYAPHVVRIYSDMASALPTITLLVIEGTHQVMPFGIYLVLAIGFLGTMLVVKEILAPPKARYWTNLITLLLLLIWGACYTYAISLPMLSMQ